MQGNDLGSYWVKKFVITDVPTIWMPPLSTPKKRFQVRRREITAADYGLNRDMVAWMVNVGRQRSIPFEVWSFNPDEEMFEQMAERLERACGDVLVGQHRWEYEEDAVLELKVDPSIHTVYDADPARVDRLWGMRGHRVLRGQTPSS